MGDKRGSVLTILVLVVLLVAGLALNWMQWNGYRLAQERLEQEELLLTLTQTRLQKLRELQQQAPQMEADLIVLSSLLPDVPLEDKLLVDFQSGADLSEMGFVQIRFGERVEKEEFMEMPMNVQFEGAYHELLHFLDYLQVYERAVRIDELRVDEADDTMMVSVRASTFYSAE
jgi:Tfp pilus assembly protein PilO